MICRTLGDERWLVDVVVRRAGLPRNGLGPLDQDILAVLRHAVCRMTTTRVLEALERLQVGRGERPACERSVRGRLASLVKVGVLSSRRRAPCGYAIEERWRR